MLDIAQKYTDILKLKFSETIYNEKYKFYNNGWCDEYRPSDTTWHTHEFVSTYKGEVIGYIAYSINRNEYDVCALKAINFTDNKIIFGRDLIRALKDIFEKFKFRKLSFGVYVGNPIEKSYDKMIQKYNGRIVGIKKKDTRLSDGNFYDYKIYEIFREDYLKSLKIRILKEIIKGVKRDERNKEIYEY